MTLEELKEEAKAKGYKLIKASPYIKLLPCKCGRKRLDQWFVTDGGTFFRCPNCGTRAPEGKTEREARKNWNFKMEEE